MSEERICLVSDCGAPETVELARRLRTDGWNVSLLDLSETAPEPQGFACQKIAGLYGATNRYIQMQSLQVYHWLRARNFDLILFHHDFAVAFYSCMARHLRLAFERTPVLILAAATHAQKLEKSLAFPFSRHDFEIEFMEERTVALADDILFEAPEITRELLDDLLEDAKQALAPASESIFISVCIATYNRATWLREALQSLERQGYPHFEVVVMDDGSTDRAVADLHEEVAPLFKQRNWQWHAQTNAGPAAARNAAAGRARGSHLLFMDDDNIACPDELERFAQAAAQDCDILGCILGMHPEGQLSFPPTAHLPEREGDATRPVGWTPIGGNLSIAAYINVMGDTNSLFRREVFEDLGGFPEGAGSVFEDVELLTHALIRGYRIDIVPEVLMLYRRTRESRSMKHDLFKGHMHSLKPIAGLLPPEMRSMLLPLRSEWYRRHCRRSGNDD